MLLLGGGGQAAGCRRRHFCSARLLVHTLRVRALTACLRPPPPHPTPPPPHPCPHPTPTPTPHTPPQEFAKSKATARKEGLTGVEFADIAGLDPILGEVRPPGLLLLGVAGGCWGPLGAAGSCWGVLGRLVWAGLG